jgi:hypothetical protein
LKCLLDLASAVILGSKSLGTPWIKVLLEKIRDTELIKEFQIILKSNIQYNVHKSSPMIPLFSNIKPVHIITPYFFNCVHCAGLLDVQNILTADTVVSPGKLKVIHSVIT